MAQSSLRIILCLLILIFYNGRVQGICPWEVLGGLPLVLEYALWRGWQQAIIYPPNNESGCQYATVRLVKCLAVNGVASAMNSTSARAQGRLGIVILSSRLRYNATGPLENLVKELQTQQMGTASYDWLITAQSDQEIRYFNKILNETSIRFDQNLVVAFPSHKHRPEIRSLGLCDRNFSYKSKTRSQNPDKTLKIKCNDEPNHKNKKCFRYTSSSRGKTEFRDGYYRATERFKNLARNHTYKKFENIWPLYNTGVVSYNYSRVFEMVNISRFSLSRSIRQRPKINFKEENTKAIRIYLVQYFKVRMNSTLYAQYLGVWSQEASMSYVDGPYPVEARNFLGEEIVVGRCNSSGDGAPTLDDDGPSAPAPLDDVLHFLTIRLNTTTSTRFYNKLGFRSYEGSWTGLLGALMDNSVDIALEPVTAHISRHQDMAFIFPIAETMFNIYIRQQETSTVRDIFLAPFSARLVACVVAVATIAALAVVVISKLAPSVRNEPRRMGITEAMIWATGILCQQGGTWTPPNPAASILLIVCLFFAVVTYNSYAAFITSVLSVRVASVDTVGAVLHSPDFKIGYIKNGADQMYLMSTKDAQLNAFYIRGYSDAENLVSSAEEGLARAASQDYAFFAGQRTARSTLRSLSQARGRCAVREVPVQSTRAHLAFPLPHHSPYARPMLVSLLQLRSGGSLARLEAVLVPDMPHCAPPPGFASARATDVRSALILLGVGYVTALLIGLAEFSLKKRKEFTVFISKCYGQSLNFLK